MHRPDLGVSAGRDYTSDRAGIGRRVSGCPAPVVGQRSDAAGLLNVDPNCLGRLAVDRHNQIGLPDAPDVDCERHIDLV